MKVHVVKPRQLSADHLQFWRDLQETNPALANPFFCPEFTLAVGEVRDDVFVGVMEDAGEVVGFFPFQRRAFGVGKPIAGPLSDYQGVIASPEIEWDASYLVRGCGLSLYDFDHMLASQNAFASYHTELTYSRTMDLSQGFETYVDGRRKAKRKIVSDHGRKARQLERDVGKLRFELHEDTPDAFAAMLAWKRDQYRSTGAYDVFQHRWTIGLLERICRVQTAGFAGVCSTLYAGDQLVAVHLGMRSRSVWHYWFPTYDRAFSRYSPGIIQILKMAEVAPSLGLSTIDLGWGDSLYKERLGDGSVPIAVGCVAQASPAAGIRRLRRATEGLFHRLPLGPLSALPKKAFDRIERRLNFT